MKKHLCSLLLLLWVFAPAANAAFIVRNQSNPVTQTADQLKLNTNNFNILTDASSPSTVSSPLLALAKKKEKSGFLAYFSLSCGVIGFAFASPQTTLIMMLLGLVAGVSGKMGLKAFKGRRGLRAMCIIGIILGAILVLYATIPILFLV